MIKKGGFHQGKRKEILRQLQEQLAELQKQEQQASLTHEKKTELYSMLKALLESDVITPPEAHKFMQEVESGNISCHAAYESLGNLLSESKGNRANQQMA